MSMKLPRNTGSFSTNFMTCSHPWRCVVIACGDLTPFGAGTACRYGVSIGLTSIADIVVVIELLDCFVSNIAHCLAILEAGLLCEF
jgi:hypothetical protein